MSLVLADPERQEPLLLYITATTYVVSTVMVVKHEDPGHAYKVQRPIYYISEVFSDSKVRYSHVQKLLYAVLIASQKLCHYFQGRHITIVPNFPLVR